MRYREKWYIWWRVYTNKWFCLPKFVFHDLQETVPYLEMQIPFKIWRWETNIWIYQVLTYKTYSNVQNSNSTMILLIPITSISCFSILCRERVHTSHKTEEYKEYNIQQDQQQNGKRSMKHNIVFFASRYQKS